MGPLILAAGMGACAAEAHDPAPADSARVVASTPPAASLPPAASRTRAALPVDWEIFRQTVTRAREAGVDTLPMGEAVARIGEGFLGTPYEPHTLEIPGPERLVVNFQALDCVTFVENALALALFLKTAPAGGPEQREEEDRARYEAILTGIRYRGGKIDGYPSRLHYFSDWIADNQARGHVRDVTAELGGVPDPEAVDFMSRHPGSYRALAEDPGAVEAIRAVEARISTRPRHRVPQDRIAEVAADIRTGDIIAATSTVRGLDVAHTGIAVWRDGVLRLLHAPLVGEAVQISERSLADRIVALEGQDGIMVARPLEPGG